MSKRESLGRLARALKGTNMKNDCSHERRRPPRQWTYDEQRGPQLVDVSHCPDCGHQFLNYSGFD